MKFIHLSDLHLGKRLHDYSMIEDQKYILIKILNIIDQEKPDAVIIAGDVYDKSIPSEDAMQIWDDFLVNLAKRNLQVFAINGNHDSAVRFSDHNILVESTGIHLSPVYRGESKPYTMEDEFGKVNIYMLPFIKPVTVRGLFPDEEIVDYTDACRVAIDHMNVDTNERNIIISHQFVTGAERSESEEIYVGTMENVSASVYDAFDYVALGHIHGPQSIGRETLRYCGTPLKYSISEKNHHKSVTVVEMGDKNDVKVRMVELEPRRDLREIRGTYDQLTARSNYEGTATEDYIHAILTDEDDIVDAVGKLRVIYPNLLKITYDNRRTRENQVITEATDVENKAPIELFEEFFEMMNNQPMSDEQKAYSLELINSILEG